jgi:ABC-type branched-subunit amino acid transport system ATPase component
MSASEPPVLRVERLACSRGGVQVLQDVSFAAGNELIAIFGLNASGKSTLLRTISGLTRATNGSVHLGEDLLTGRRAYDVMRRGVSFMPQIGQCFPSLTVAENLDLGGYVLPRSEVPAARERVVAMFPRLAERLRTRAGDLSGGEQQMLALARALMPEPKLLLLDEPSAGLSPAMIDVMWGKLAELRDDGVPIVMVEQNVRAALRIADRALILRLGRCAAEIPVGGDTAIHDVQEAMLGMASAPLASSNGTAPDRGQATGSR